MMKQYTLIEQIKSEDFPFNIKMLEHNYDVDVHDHDCTELVIILEGTAMHLIDEEEYKLKAGDVFVINGNSRHGYKNAHNLKLCNIMFHYSQLADNNNDLKQLPGFQSLFILEPVFRKEHNFESKLALDPEGLNFTKELLDVMLTEYSEQVSGYKSVVWAYFLTLAAYFSRQFYSRRNIASSKLINLESAITYIENNYVSPLNISDVASMAYLSTRQFDRIFKSAYKISPKQYIIMLRLKNACKLMKNSNMSLSTIAVKCGFWDISFFSRQFRAKYGISPREYRNFNA